MTGSKECDLMIAVNIPIEAARDAASVLRYLVSQLAETGQIAADRVDAVVDALKRREELGSTNIGRGFAFPHIIEPSLTETTVIVGLLPQPLHWDGGSEKPVNLVYLAIARDRQNWLLTLEEISTDLGRRSGQS
jgi:mannitol/fructose-specific phosphotransferase system IIA component (Ntr-type)